MHNLDALRRGEYQNAGLTRFKHDGPLDAFPLDIFSLGDTLEHLDLSGTGLASLPPDFGAKLPHLKIAFFSNCSFAAFPAELAACPSLEMVAFRNNGMRQIPDDAFPPRLRWLILTDNQIASLPASIGQCHRLQKCMLAGNQLTTLPDAMARCTKLGLLRLSANRLAELPAWLFSLPELSFLSFAGNPCVTLAEAGARAGAAAGGGGGADHEAPGLAHISWASLSVQHTLGSGASGIISQALWHQSPDFAEEVAVKLFRGALTSDGTPRDEMQACLAAGDHENLIGVLGRIHGHPDEDKGEGKVPCATTFRGGIVMHLIPPQYTVLGQPPSLASCTRDSYPPDAKLDARHALNLLLGVAGAARHLHASGIAHGDVYAHNILTNPEDGHALLGDFGAATIYADAGESDGDGAGEHKYKYGKMESLEVLAFAHLVEDVLGLLQEDPAGEGNIEGLSIEELKAKLGDLHAQCSVADPSKRPPFAGIEAEVQKLVGWRDIMRLPN